MLRGGLGFSGVIWGAEGGFGVLRGYLGFSGDIWGAEGVLGC